MRRWVIGATAVLVVVGVVAAFAFGGLGQTALPGATPTPLPPVPKADRVVAEARVVPASWAIASASVPGTVASVAAAEGDRVTAGAVLLELDGAAAAAEVAAARAGLDAATAAADQAEAAVTQAAAEADRAVASVDVAKAVRDQLPSSASRARERQADAEVSAAEAGLAAAQAARSGAAAAATAAEADVARAQAGLDAAEAAAARLVITAPISGSVADLEASAGDVVAAGAPLVRIAGDGGWTFETTDLTQDEVAGVAVGADATITVDGYADISIPGRVTRIAPFGEDRQGDVVFAVIVEPTGDVPEWLRWNMLASAQIATAP